MGLTSEGLPASEELADIRTYTVVYHDGNGYYYECNDHSSPMDKRSLSCIKDDCPVTASMDSEVGSPLIDKGLHNHPSDSGFRDKCIVLGLLRQRFLNEEKSVVSVLQEVLSILAEEEPTDSSSPVISKSQKEVEEDLTSRRKSRKFSSSKVKGKVKNIVRTVSASENEPTTTQCDPSSTTKSRITVKSVSSINLPLLESFANTPETSSDYDEPVTMEFVEEDIHLKKKRRTSSQMSVVLWKCKFCSKQFNSRSNFTRHLRTVHKRTKDGEPLPEALQEKFICALCGKMFAHKCTLQQHYNAIHLNSIHLCDKCPFQTNRESTLKRHILKVHLKESKFVNSSEYFECSLCFAKYKVKRNLQLHQKKVHNIGKFNNMNMNKTCPLCKTTVTGLNNSIIYKHFEEVHQIKISFEELFFNSIDEFFSWKKDIETETTSVYRQTKGKDRCSIYKCHRSGFYKGKGSNKRNLKKIGSCKINGFCPAVLKVKPLENGAVRVLYGATHVGHLNEVKYLYLSKEDKLEIATKLANNVSHKDILKEIKNSASSSDLRRIHLLKKKDLINIEQNLKNKHIDVDHCFNVEFK